ncbi:Competence protein [Candidatus Rubidus massiliensis]|nr:Competence protein [Candidatus Rubidus massiliensis]
MPNIDFQHFMIYFLKRLRMNVNLSSAKVMITSLFIKHYNNSQALIMQLYAETKYKQIIHVNTSKKEEEYFCLECKNKVRPRKGSLRQQHFYHVNLSPDCRQSNKSAEHIQTQIFIQKILDERDCFLEHPFREINRIADVYWQSQKLVFEIQCSSISPLEMHERMLDYQKIGLEVVWILHQKTFQKKFYSKEEKFLIHHSHYYTSIDKYGEGEIYDLFYCEKEKARYFLAKRAINLSACTKVKPKGALGIPPNLYLRKKYWKIFNKDDFYHFACSSLNNKLSLKKLEEGDLFLKSSFYNGLTQFFSNYIKLPIKVIYQTVLENSCK